MQARTAHRLAVAATVAIAGLTVSPVAPAATAADQCATHAEFKKIKNGMSLTKARHIFGFRGHKLYQDPGEFGYYWASCGGADKGAGLAFHRPGGVFQKRWGPSR